ATSTTASGCGTWSRAARRPSWGRTTGRSSAWRSRRRAGRWRRAAWTAPSSCGAFPAPGDRPRAVTLPRPPTRGADGPTLSRRDARHLSEEIVMLVLGRKVGERVVIGDGIVVTVLAVRGLSVRLGIEAPRSVPVNREELLVRRGEAVPERALAGAG